MKTLCKNKHDITTDDVEQIIAVEKSQKVPPIKKRKISFDEEKLRMYCPDMTDEQIAEMLYEFLNKEAKLQPIHNTRSDSPITNARGVFILSVMLSYSYPKT